MSTSRDPKLIVQTERRVLEVLCQGTAEGSVRETARRHLRDYHWREPLHQVVFEVLMAMPGEAPALVRDQLPARLTRKGFPDVDWEQFFEPHSSSLEEAEALMRELRESES
jgi:hypothetical protein